MRSRGSGFTLIELLVVIAIIAILAAILFPVFGHAKKRAQVSTCKSNMRSIASAMQMYIDDWSSCYPDQSSVGFAYTGDYSNPLGESWIRGYSHRYLDDYGKAPGGMAVTLSKYLKNLGVFKCPAELVKRPSDAAGWLPYKIGSSYYYKHALCYYANYYKRPVKASMVTHSSRATLMYEEDWHSDSMRPFLWDPGYYSGKDRDPYKRVNAIFVDCHVGVIYVPFNPISGYDSNWYFYGSGWDLSKGARDRK